MTTKFLDNKFALSKFDCRGVSHESALGRCLSSLPPKPTPLKSVPSHTESFRVIFNLSGYFHFARLILETLRKYPLKQA